MLLSSLTNRIFLAAALLVVLAIGVTAAFVSIRVTSQAEAELQRRLIESGTVVARQSEVVVETFSLLARLTADLPKLKAAVATADAPTVQPLAVEYLQMLARSSLVVVTDQDGRILGWAATAALGPAPPSELPSVRAAVGGRSASSFLAHPSGILQVLSVPITVGAAPVDLAGSLSLGFLLDRTLANDFRRVTGSEIAFGLDGRIRAATLPARAWPALEQVLRAGGVSSVSVDGDEYVLLSKPLAPGGAATAGEDAGAGGAFVVVARSRTEQLRFLGPIRTVIAATVVVAMLLAVVLSYAVARTVTRPLAAITAVMREVAATGDLTRKIPTRGRVWEDEDARLLASTFNTLTDSIARFEREAAQRERLSSLGRLSSVVAHEVRNPLMIVKAAARTLRQPDTNAEARLEALQDIDAEVVRLNRIVTEVLDYAKPLTFTWHETDSTAVCREAAQAVGIAEPGVEIAVAVDVPVEPLVTDGDRVRTVLVIVLTNASQAVGAARDQAGAPPPPGPGVVLRAAPRSGGGVVITVIDHGGGIDPQLLPRVFEPYFTTRRGGTGLGLAIARSIVEGLGGTMTIRSERCAGTELRIELPARGPGAPDGMAGARG
jgi:signal transduction histidine kinase